MSRNRRNGAKSDCTTENDRARIMRRYVRQAEAAGLASDPPFPALPSFSVALKPSNRLAGDSGFQQL